MASLKKYVNVHQSESYFYERRSFYHARQKRGESVFQWGERVIVLASKCGFSTEMTMLIRDIFVVGMCSGAIQDRLLVENPLRAEVTFPFLMDIVSKIEISMNNKTNQIKKNNAEPQKTRKKSKKNPKMSEEFKLSAEKSINANSYAMSKEINKNESLRCIEKAQQYLKNKHFELAVNILMKSKKLFPLQRADELLREIYEIKETRKSKINAYSNAMSKEINKDGSLRCIEKAQLYIKNKQFELAENILMKSKKLFPLQRADELLREIYEIKETRKSSINAYSCAMPKEINKDESLRCIEKAQQYIQNKNFELAENFLMKSKKLFPLPIADQILTEIQDIKKEISKQANIVKKVKNSENFYILFEIKTNATVREIKKAYKKLALLLHPDKNSAPGAGEMFSVLSNAVNILCDPTKRKMYDQKLKLSKNTTTTEDPTPTSTPSSNNII